MKRLQLMILGLVCSFCCLAFGREDILLHEDEWRVKPDKASSVKAYKGQRQSLVDWEALDPNVWLDFNHWKKERALRDASPDWQDVIRDRGHRELVGKVIQCLNECSTVDREGELNAQFGSLIREGDEFVTAKDSYAWIFLADGGLVRVSPETSLSFLEINIAPGKIFFSVRLNQGHVYFQHRRTGSFPKQDLAETDLAMLPLLMPTANREYYARQEYRKLDARQKILYALRDNPGKVLQYDALNEYLAKGREKFQEIDSEVFIFTSSATLLVQNPHFHIFHELAGPTWFKLKEKIPGLVEDDPRSQTATVWFRGYENVRSESPELNYWHKMDRAGKALQKVASNRGFNILDHFIKRIPSIQLARELMLLQMSQFMFAQVWEPRGLAEDYGYRMWNEEKELEPRKQFLLEYTRRMETTNIAALEKLYGKAEAQGVQTRHYAHALKKSLLALKNRSAYNKQAVVETDEGAFYLWILRHADSFLPAYLR